MGTWFWLNIPLMVLIFCCWVGIPLWLTLGRWNDEVNARHAELAARTVTAPTVTQSPSTAAAAYETGGPAYAQLAYRQGR